MKTPVTYSPEVAERILDGLIEGRTLTSICSTPDMPDRRTVINWCQNVPEFAKRYDAANELKADFLFDEILDIADGRETVSQTDRIQSFLEAFDTTDLSKGHGRTILIADRLMRIDARKYIVSKLRPRKYGQATQVEITGDPNKPITTITRIEIVAPQLAGPAEKKLIEQQVLPAIEGKVVVNAEN